MTTDVNAKVTIVKFRLKICKMRLTDEDTDGCPDGLLDPRGVGTDETVGFAELVGVTVGTADADGPLETVGMLEIYISLQAEK
jgi:hypothetical protein